MKALPSTLLVGFVIACSNQQPATSAAMPPAEEPVTITSTNATGEAYPTEQSNKATSAATTARPSSAAATTATTPDRANAAATPTAPNNTASNNTAPDNTKVNQRDQKNNEVGANAPTPLDQGESESDLSATQQIRKAVMADGSLSFTAKNVKIITLNGKVTLRGPVNSASERAAIEAAARRAPGVTSVDNQLEVKP